MSRGIVMETGSKHVIVLMPDGQFRKVRTALKPRIGEEFIFAEQRRLQRPRKLYSFSAGAAAVMILLFAPFIVQHFSKQPNVVAYLTMDVNPSIELGIDKNEHVEVLRAINADGAAVTKDLAFKGLPLQQVTEAIMDRISAGPYLNSGEGDVVITSVAVGSGVLPANEVDLTSHMDTAVRKSLAKTDKGRELKVEVTTLSAPAEIRDEAERAGVSSGKMAFYLMAKEQGYRISIKQLKTESIHQAAKPMGGVAAVLNDGGGKDDIESGKGKEGIGANGGKVADTTPIKQQTNEPQNPASAKEASKETLREQQKQQLQELLKHEQEKRKEREESGGHRPGDHGPDDRGSRDGDDKPNDAKSDNAKNGGPKNDDAKNGANPANVPLKNSGMINVSDDQHSPGNNNGSHGKGGGSKQGDSGKPVKAPAPPPPQQPPQSHSNSDSRDNGGHGHSGSNGKGNGGSDEAKNASGGRHEGVQPANGNGGGKPAKEEDSSGSDRDKDDDRAKDDDRGKNGGRGKDADDSDNHGSGDNRSDDGDKNHSRGGKGR
ncbi:anti-sigma factor domain-containing protein [Paenibacillus glycinis]|uniref:Anti-sigma factor domain-containing protein n=1 Tax=Paenibacillus glycinis TaxID=2697035 RepID=A0ABW9XVD4_9BACL|nr:anti-sigma factor domain-containing protein [Paenibacillus glycinis]NBD26649.1 anti-sigma factor domain-containing protein [Paenibacillus glycinis]